MPLFNAEAYFLCSECPLLRQVPFCHFTDVVRCRCDLIGSLNNRAIMMPLMTLLMLVSNDNPLCIKHHLWHTSKVTKWNNSIKLRSVVKIQARVTILVACTNLFIQRQAAGNPFNIHKKRNLVPVHIDTAMVPLTATKQETIRMLYYIYMIMNRIRLIFSFSDHNLFV